MILTILQNIERKNIDYFDFYLFLFVAITFIIIKLNDSSYFNRLFGQFSLKSFSKEDGFPEKSILSFSSFLLVICYIFLFSLLFYAFFDKNGGIFQFFQFILLFAVFTILQLIGAFVFEKMIDYSEIKSHFFSFKLHYNEIVTVTLFPLILFVNYAFPTLFWILILIVILVQIINIVRTAIYLSTFISYFHILLYLCTSEIILILFLVKYLPKPL